MTQEIKTKFPENTEPLQQSKSLYYGPVNVE